uniref:Uncharacterized protein n=1 Tax=viral metagenome TaxID=1070528 RepID=A0A6H1ZZ98_9ZZZZ
MEIIETGNGPTKYYRLKIKKEHYITMAKAIDPHVTSETRQVYRDKGLSKKRFRWDMLWKSGFDVSPLYDYLNDNHIDTALKHIVE